MDDQVTEQSYRVTADELRQFIERLERLEELHAMEIDEEVDGVAVGAAGEAVVEALPRHHVHRGLRILVERTQPDELVPLGVESHLLRHQRHDVRGIEDAVSVVGSGGCGQGREDPGRGAWRKPRGRGWNSDERRSATNMAPPR